MAVGVLLITALSAPAEAPSPEPEMERIYEGPSAPEGMVPTPEADRPAQEAPIEPAPKPDDGPSPPEGAQTEIAGGSTMAARGQSVDDLRARRVVPRLLSRMEGFPPDEVASLRHGRLKFTPGLQIRNQVGWVSDFPLDRYGETYEEGAFSTGRIRWNPELKIGRDFTIVGMLDLVNGQWAPGSSEDPVIQEIYDRGQPPGREPLDEVYPHYVDPRELFIEYRSTIGLFRIGQMSFTWGQGILANDGNNVDRFGDMTFGDDGPGDLIERVVFATRPFGGPIGSAMVVAVGGDLVFRDERAQLVDGDLAGQAILVVRYQPESRPGNWVGGYAVYRNQHTADDGDVYQDDDDLQVGVGDLAGQGTYWLRPNLQLIGAFEGVIIGGKTTIARDEFGDHDVLQGGFATRGYIGNHEVWLAGFDAGYASGDPNPNDRQINNFTFDAGHPVGLLMFPFVHGWRTARSEMLATNGQLLGQPPNGSQFIPTRGGVTNAIYIFPKARYAWRERIEVWGGPLFAGAPVAVVDPFATELNGGVPTNALAGSGDNRFYGTELDLGVRARFDIQNFWLQAGLQGGILLPGKAMADATGSTGGPIGGIWFRTEIRY